MASTQIIGGLGGQYDIVFDAEKDHILQFTYNGNQIFKHQLIIRDNLTNDIVYDQTVVTMSTRHTIAAGSLTNGKTYNAAIQVYYKNDEGLEVADKLSDTALLKCYATPILSFVDMPTTVRNATYTFSISYSQAQDDYIDSYIITLYDGSGVRLYDTGRIFPATTTLPYSFSVTIPDLMDGHSYYISCDARSLSGMAASTGRQNFLVEYVRPQNYSVLYVSNEYNSCSARIASNIKIIDGHTQSGKEPNYFSDDEADLRYDWAYWNEMLNVSGNFQMLVRIRDVVPYQTLVRITNGLDEIVLRTNRGKLYGISGEKDYIELRVKNQGVTYTTMSQPIDPPSDTEMLLVRVVKRSYLYELSLEKEATTNAI